MRQYDLTKPRSVAAIVGVAAILGALVIGLPWVRSGVALEPQEWRENPLERVPPTCDILAASGISGIEDEVPDQNGHAKALGVAIASFGGYVVESGTGSALPAHRVVLALHPGPEGRRAATSDRSGRFRIDVNSADPLMASDYPVDVTDPFGQKVFRGSVSIQHEAWIRVEPPVLLHGSVHCSDAVEYPVAVGITVPGPRWNPGEQTFVKGEVDKHGRFELHSRTPVQGSPDVEVRLVDSRQGLCATGNVAYSRLTSPSGAAVHFATKPLLVKITDSLGRLVPDAKVRFWRASTGQVVRERRI